jgi:hypothetical protein
MIYGYMILLICMQIFHITRITPNYVVDIDIICYNKNLINNN